MPTFRLYTGSDGQSHVEPIDLAKHPEWTKGLATTQIAFREDPVGRFIDWHPAPRRQFVIILSGQLDIGLGDRHGDVPLTRAGAFDFHLQVELLSRRFFVAVFQLGAGFDIFVFRRHVGVLSVG